MQMIIWDIFGDLFVVDDFMRPNVALCRTVYMIMKTPFNTANRLGLIQGYFWSKILCCDEKYYFR